MLDYKIVSGVFVTFSCANEKPALFVLAECFKLCGVYSAYLNLVIVQNEAPLFQSRYATSIDFGATLLCKDKNGLTISVRELLLHFLLQKPLYAKATVPLLY